MLYTLGFTFLEWKAVYIFYLIRVIRDLKRIVAYYQLTRLDPICQYYCILTKTHKIFLVFKFEDKEAQRRTIKSMSYCSNIYRQKLKLRCFRPDCSSLLSIPAEFQVVTAGLRSDLSSLWALCSCISMLSVQMLAKLCQQCYSVTFVSYFGTYYPHDWCQHIWVPTWAVCAI